jgi:hypothetical protein
MIERGWTDMDKNLQKKIKAQKNNTGKKVDYDKIDQFVGLMYAIEMDHKNKIETFQSLGMCDPFDPIESIEEAISEMKTVDFYTHVYAESILSELLEATRYHRNIKPPKCVFLMEKELIVKIIRAVALYGNTDTKEAFLLRFGLLEDENWYLAQPFI